jgi:hypothetical protein
MPRISLPVLAVCIFDLAAWLVIALAVSRCAG